MPRISMMVSVFGHWIRNRYLTHFDLLPMLAANGFNGVEIFNLDFRGNTSLVRDYSKAVADQGLEFVAVDVISDLVHLDPASRARARDELRREIELTVKLGAKIAHVAGSTRKEGISPADGRKQIAEALLDQADFADAHGLVLAIEDYDPAPDMLCRKSDCLDLLALTDNRVKMVFDTGNFLAVGERADENLADCYEHIVLCHFKDFGGDSRQPTVVGFRKPVYTRLGCGIIPNAIVANMLMERKYDGWVSLEPYPDESQPAEANIVHSIETVRKWFSNG